MTGASRRPMSWAAAAEWFVTSEDDIVFILQERGMQSEPA